MSEDLAPYIQHNLKLHRKIGMFISGGFDSALLLYLVNEINNRTFKKEKNRSTLTAYTVPKYDGSYDHSPNVVKWVNPNIEIKTVGDKDLPHNKQVGSGVKEVMLSGEQDQVYIAHTVVHDWMDFPGGLKVVRQENKHPKFIFMPHMDMKLDKADTIRLAKDLLSVDQFKQLCEITHSCTQTTGKRCGVCWHCQERAWGFKQAEMTDYGEM